MPDSGTPPSRLSRAARLARALRLPWGLPAREPPTVSADAGPPRLLDYAAWLSARRSLWAARRRADLARLKAAGPLPLLTIVLTAEVTSLRRLGGSLQSLRAQSYPRWELLIVERLGRTPETQALLARACRSDRRMRMVRSAAAADPVEAVNGALAAAAGTHVGFLRPGDELAPHALMAAALRLADNRAAVLIYGDEDSLGASGRHHAPRFKCRWNPDLLLAQDYLGDPCLLERGRLRALGGLRSGFTGAERYDLLLRATAGLPSGGVEHIAEVLYHRRAKRTGVVEDPQILAARSDAGRRAAAEAAAAMAAAEGLPAPRVEPGLLPASHRLLWTLPQPGPLVTLIVPTRDRLGILAPCLESILRLSSYRDFEILVVDNDSEEPATLAYLDRLPRQEPQVRVLRQAGAFNYSALNNAAVAQARGTILGLINNDVEVLTPGWLEELVGHAQRPAIGCVGAMLLYPNDTIQHAGVIIGVGPVAAHGHRHFPRDAEGYLGRLKVAQNLSAVTGACLFLRRALYEEVGGLNESDLKVAYNDVDLCLRTRAAGYRNLWTPHAVLRHHESLSRGHDDTPEKHAREMREQDYMCATWGAQLRGDPAYSPWLTPYVEDFSLHLTA